MSYSVNTNAGALVALQNLNATQKQMDITQNRINTGLNVASTKDDSAKYTQAQQLRGDLGGLQSITSSLNNAKSVIDVAVSGTEQISDILNNMKSLSLQARDADPTEQAKMDSDFQAYKAQISNIVASSQYNGKNLLDGGSDVVQATMSLYGGSGGGSANGAWNPNSLNVANQGLGGSAGSLATILTTGSAGLSLVDSTSGTVGDNADTARQAVETAFDSVQAVLGTLGSASRRIDDQITFAGKLADTVQTGIGNLVDADLAKESANLQALQVKQQLGVQALSIANQAPQTILSLFR